MKKPDFYNEKIVAQNKYLYVKQSDFFDSQKRTGNIITLHTTNNCDGGSIFAITKDKKIILNKEYKFGPDSFEYNFPSGHFRSGLSESENIKRELLEETGFTSDNEVVYLGESFRNGYMGGKSKFFLLTECYQKTEPKTHEGEEIETYFLSFDELEKMMKNNEIQDPYTQICYFRGNDYLKNIF